MATDTEEIQVQAIVSNLEPLAVAAVRAARVALGVTGTSHEVATVAAALIRWDAEAPASDDL